MDDHDLRLVERFMPGGRLRRVPSKASKRRLVLEHVAQLFEPGVRYSERQVDAILTGVCEGGETDHVSLRRYLVDAQLLGRESGEYWRIGGWVYGT
ncbi:MAG: DUF2087 domain-containing protein [Nocardioidaceae bacterium]|nr:DUF2087 domain-containing protein [Nocardioidaceae bacterium]NUS51633.1 DUF2087 domain-containing protein [Nocardioidaceae bacterium]